MPVTPIPITPMPVTPAPTQAPATDAPDAGKASLGTGAIIGIVVGVLVFLSGCVCAVRMWSSRAQANIEGEPNTELKPYHGV